MGSWADLTLSNDTLEGMVPNDMLDRDFAVFDSDLNTTKRLNEVKEYIELRVMQQMPLFSERADGPEEILDAAIDISKGFVDSAIQRMIGYLYISNFYEAEALGGGGLYLDKSERYRIRFEEAFDGLMKHLLRDPDYIEQLETTTDNDLDSFAQPNWIG